MIREEDISPSMACPDCWETVSTPMCNGCKRWQCEDDTCSRYPRGIPKKIRYEEYHKCPCFELNPDDEVNYDFVKKTIERMEK